MEEYKLLFCSGSSLVKLPLICVKGLHFGVLLPRYASKRFFKSMFCWKYHQVALKYDVSSETFYICALDALISCRIGLNRLPLLDSWPQFKHLPPGETKPWKQSRFCLRWVPTLSPYPQLNSVVGGAVTSDRDSKRDGGDPSWQKMHTEHIKPTSELISAMLKRLQIMHERSRALHQCFGDSGAN